jgi:hypothetical protein
MKVSLLLLVCALTPAWSLSQLITPSASSPSRPVATHSQPNDATGWFRRADKITNIRMLGSVPFHMRVTFHAFPGTDFAPKGKSTIQTGDGVYEETWLSPETWRREVVFGPYRAVEVRANGVRKFQSNSEYEPSRVVMLLRGLLLPIPRYVVEPELEDRHFRWKIEHQQAGSIPYVRISFTDNLGRYGSEVRAYDFLPNGILVRFEEGYTGLLTGWQDDVAFGEKIVPRHLTVEGNGLSGPLLTADVAVEPALATNAAIFQIEGDGARPGMTLRPYVQTEFDLAPAIHFETPGSWATTTTLPVGVNLSAIGIVDRDGTTREIEVGAIRVYGQPPSSAQMADVMQAARVLVKSMWKDRFHPALVDGDPCQYVFSVEISKGGDDVTGLQ